MCGARKDARDAAWTVFDIMWSVGCATVFTVNTQYVDQTLSARQHPLDIDTFYIILNFMYLPTIFDAQACSDCDSLSSSERKWVVKGIIIAILQDKNVLPPFKLADYFRDMIEIVNWFIFRQYPLDKMYMSAGTNTHLLALSSHSAS